MNANNKYSNTEFIRFVLGSMDFISSDSGKAREYMSSQGLNVDAIVSEGLKRIKKLQMQIQAGKTQMEMISAETVKQKAKEWVDSLLNNIDFSLPALVKEEELSMSFRNIESLSQEDIKNILVKHFTLKFLEEQKIKSNGL
ncbi:MAG: hypothetical protein FVQ77_05260 [Cytophagales bacterium]|nr:hypothetical protein [Cytophagales bacterium]